MSDLAELRRLATDRIVAEVQRIIRTKAPLNRQWAFDNSAFLNLQAASDNSAFLDLRVGSGTLLKLFRSPAGHFSMVVRDIWFLWHWVDIQDYSGRSIHSVYLGGPLTRVTWSLLRFRRHVRRTIAEQARLADQNRVQEAMDSIKKIQIPTTGKLMLASTCEEGAPVRHPIWRYACDFCTWTGHELPNKCPKCGSVEFMDWRVA